MSILNGRGRSLSLYICYLYSFRFFFSLSPISPAQQLHSPFLSRFNCFGDFFHYVFSFRLFTHSFIQDFLSHTHTNTYSFHFLTLSLSPNCVAYCIFLFIFVFLFTTPCSILLVHIIAYKYPTLEIIPLTERKTEKEKEMCAP